MIGVPAEKLEPIWPVVEPLLEKALEGNCGEVTTFDVYQGIKSRDLQLWVIYDGSVQAAVITEIINYPRKKTCRALQVAGSNMDEWMHLIQVIEDWAKEQGARSMELIGRKGWERYMKQYGFSFEHVTLNKEF